MIIVIKRKESRPYLTLFPITYSLIGGVFMPPQFFVKVETIVSKSDGCKMPVYTLNPLFPTV
jgi:hypothetical protein